MRKLQVLRGLIAAAITFLPASALAQIQLNTVVSGLSSPVFVGNAGDGSNRLFIVEQAGIIKVLQPGSSTPTVFLNIQSKVLSGGERGLLGLAFHPSVRHAGQQPVLRLLHPRRDGALVIGNTRRRVSIPTQPNGDGENRSSRSQHSASGNHNGGMLAFGPDGYLYIGVGDGGGANDPFRTTRRTSIRCSARSSASTSTPGVLTTRFLPDNPFAGVAGADEIYAFGMRNPWRFSFDRQPGQLWVGDVGQGHARGSGLTDRCRRQLRLARFSRAIVCNSNDPTACSNPSRLHFPLFEYRPLGRLLLDRRIRLPRRRRSSAPGHVRLRRLLLRRRSFGWNGIDPVHAARHGDEHLVVR